MTTVILLGAGASKAVNIPTTEDMAKEFLERTKNADLLRLFEKRDSEDIETIIKAVHQIRELQNNQGIKLLKLKDKEILNIKRISAEFHLMEDMISSFIREKCLKPNLSVAKKLYKPILDLQNITPVKIFTTNYDVVIEDVCHSLEMGYTDGFIKEKHGYHTVFQPTAFNQQILQLYKLHGSVNWWSDDTRQKIIKLSPDMDVGLDKYENMMIYPAQKEDVFNYPFNFLQWFFTNTLDKVNQLIAIGHKFGDPNITATVNAALENPDFQLTIVNPSATTIKKEVFNNHKKVEAIDKKFEDWLKSGIKKLKQKILEENKKIELERSKIKKEKEKLQDYAEKIRDLEEQLDDYQNPPQVKLFEPGGILSANKFEHPTAIDFSKFKVEPLKIENSKTCSKCDYIELFGINANCPKCGNKLD